MAKKDKNEARKFVLRLRPETMAAVEKWAADEFRSINGQLEWIIYNALKDAGRLKKPKNADQHNTSPPDDTTAE